MKTDYYCASQIFSYNFLLKTQNILCSLYSYFLSLCFLPTSNDSSSTHHLFFIVKGNSGFLQLSLDPHRLFFLTILRYSFQPKTDTLFTSGVSASAQLAMKNAKYCWIKYNTAVVLSVVGWAEQRQFSLTSQWDGERSRKVEVRKHMGQDRQLSKKRLEKTQMVER